MIDIPVEGRCPNVGSATSIISYLVLVCPGSLNSFNFMQFLGKYGQIVCWCPPGSCTPSSGKFRFRHCIHHTLYPCYCAKVFFMCKIQNANWILPKGYPPVLITNCLRTIHTERLFFVMKKINEFTSIHFLV